jgi:hypothetical protein
VHGESAGARPALVCIGLAGTVDRAGIARLIAEAGRC